MNSTVAVS